MQIVSIGGGPAGLYLAILMKKADPTHEIVVYERNRPDDTFGFGVVFSDATLEGTLTGPEAGDAGDWKTTIQVCSTGNLFCAYVTYDTDPKTGKLVIIEVGVTLF